jgi:nucleotide-binding universal stress UspA family protein
MTQRVGADLIGLSVARDERDLPTAQAIVGRLKKEAASQRVKLKTLVLQGRPFEAIVQAAKDEKVDLIVMGTLGMTELTSLLMGSTTERVIAQAPCSVMVVKRLM